jgi:hypothetical protein
MTEPLYFVLGAVHGSPHTRYAVLGAQLRDTHEVVEVLVSRPDGEEVAGPLDIRMRLRPFVGGPLSARLFNNANPLTVEESRRRAGEKGARALAERRLQRAAA